MKLGLLYQAWRNLQAKPLQTALSLALLAFGVGMVSLMLLTERQVNEAFERNIKDIVLQARLKGALCGSYVKLDPLWHQLAGNTANSRRHPLPIDIGYWMDQVGGGGAEANIHCKIGLLS